MDLVAEARRAAAASRARERRRHMDAEAKAREAARQRERRRQADSEARAKQAAAARERRRRMDAEARANARAREAARKRQRRRELALMAANENCSGGVDASCSSDALGMWQQLWGNVVNRGEFESRMPCLRHSCGQLADQLTCVPVGLTETMLPCTCGQELNGTSPPQHTDSEATTTTIKTEPEESAASDEEFMEMPLAIEMGIGEEPCNPAVAVKEEPPDIPAASTGNAGDANEILGVTGIETLVLPSELQAEEDLEDKPRVCKEEAHSTCLP